MNWNKTLQLYIYNYVHLPPCSNKAQPYIGVLLLLFTEMVPVDEVNQVVIPWPDGNPKSGEGEEGGDKV